MLGLCESEQKGKLFILPVLGEGYRFPGWDSAGRLAWVTFSWEICQDGSVGPRASCWVWLSFLRNHKETSKRVVLRF